MRLALALFVVTALGGCYESKGGDDAGATVDDAGGGGEGGTCRPLLDPLCAAEMDTTAEAVLGEAGRVEREPPVIGITGVTAP